MGINKTKRKYIRGICPYCEKSYKKSFNQSMMNNRSGISKNLIKPHELCREFYIMLDSNGSLRGCQSFDDISFENLLVGNFPEDLTKILDNLKKTPTNISEFIFTIDLKLGKTMNQGIIKSQKTMYHQYLRSPDFQKWIYYILKSKTIFNYQNYGDIIIFGLIFRENLFLCFGLNKDKIKYYQNNYTPIQNLFDLKNLIFKIGNLLIKLD